MRRSLIDEWEFAVLVYLPLAILIIVIALWTVYMYRRYTVSTEDLELNNDIQPN